MNEYEVEVTIIAKIEAPNESDAADMVLDHFGPGEGGEGVTVITSIFQFLD